MVIPDPDTLKALRVAAGLTQLEAAALVHLKGIMTWSRYETGAAPISGAVWELFLIKTGHHAHYRPARGVLVPKARKVKP